MTAPMAAAGRPQKFIGMAALAPLDHHSDEDISESIRINFLSNIFGFETWRDRLQEECCVAAVRGRNILAQLPTAHGKTVVALLPALVVGGTTVVIEPTISLVESMVQKSRQLEITAFGITGSSTHGEKKLATDVAILQQGAVFFTTPETACSNEFRRILDKLTLKRIVIDEAHCAHEWSSWRSGYSMLPSWLSKETLMKGVSCTLLSATFSRQFYHCIPQITGLPVATFKTVYKSTYRSNLRITFQCVSSRKNVWEKIVQKLRTIPVHDCALIYCRSVRKACELSDFIRQKDSVPECNVYTSKVRKDLRQIRLSSWLIGHTRVLVGTEAVGLGINHERLNCVIMEDMPSSVSSLAQRAGRSGRGAGSPQAECIIFYNLSTNISGWLLVGSLSGIGTVFTVGDSAEEAEIDANFGDGPSEELGGDDVGGLAVGWDGIELRNQRDADVLSGGVAVTHMALLALRSQLGGCASRQVSAHFTPPGVDSSKEDSENCSGCSAREQNAIFVDIDATSTAKAILNVMILLRNIGIDRLPPDTLVLIIRRSQNKQISRFLEKMSMTASRSVLSLRHDLRICLDSEYGISRPCPLSESQVQHVILCLIAEENKLRWWAAKGHFQYTVKNMFH